MGEAHALTDQSRPCHSRTSAHEAGEGPSGFMCSHSKTATGAGCSERPTVLITQSLTVGQCGCSGLSSMTMCCALPVAGRLNPSSALRLETNPTTPLRRRRRGAQHDRFSALPHPQSPSAYFNFPGEEPAPSFSVPPPAHSPQPPPRFVRSSSTPVITLAARLALGHIFCLPPAILPTLCSNFCNHLERAISFTLP